jgi:tRNA(Arg) A34 adenosine deaminase TadA
MSIAFDEAIKGMNGNKGGPFGAIVVLDGKIIGKGCNMVTSTNDPTAHAEVVAIRNACRATKQFHLKGAVIYATCEPCPMCLSAIYWANIDSIYYCATKNDAKSIGFDDSYIYREFRKSMGSRSIPCKRIESPLSEKLFRQWTKKKDRIPY